VVEEHFHRASVGSGQRQREGILGSRSAGGEETKTDVALVDDTRRPLPALVPDAGGPPFLSNARFVLAPELQALTGMVSRQRLERRRQLIF
jgi:hypothetical protein